MNFKQFWTKLTLVQLSGRVEAWTTQANSFQKETSSIEPETKPEDSFFRKLSQDLRSCSTRAWGLSHKETHLSFERLLENFCKHFPLCLGTLFDGKREYEYFIYCIVSIIMRSKISFKCSSKYVTLGTLLYQYYYIYIYWSMLSLHVYELVYTWF